MTRVISGGEADVEYYVKLPYTMIVERRDDQGIYYVASYVELPDLLMTGETPEEAVAELEKVKPEWIEAYLKLGNKMPEPLKGRAYSGEYRLRMPSTLHEEAALMAEREGVSLNQYTVTALARAVGRDEGKLGKKKPRSRSRIVP